MKKSQNKQGRPKEAINTYGYYSEVKVKCKCGRTHKVARTWDVLELVDHIEVSFCPICEDRNQGKGFEEKHIIYHRTRNGYRHRFGKHPVVNGREVRLKDDHETVSTHKYGFWKGYLRHVREESGFWTWRYVEECVCDNRQKGREYDETRQRCLNCGGAIPTRAELREKKQLYDPEKSKKRTTG
jgi:hypothetical protein